MRAGWTMTGRPSDVAMHGGYIYKSIKKNQKIYKRCKLRDEVPKSKQTRCRDSLSTKLNVHSPIPTSVSHVTATALGDY